MWQSIIIRTLDYTDGKIFFLSIKLFMFYKTGTYLGTHYLKAKAPYTSSLSPGRRESSWSVSCVCLFTPRRPGSPDASQINTYDADPRLLDTSESAEKNRYNNLLKFFCFENHPLFTFVSSLIAPIGFLFINSFNLQFYTIR